MSQDDRTADDLERELQQAMDDTTHDDHDGAQRPDSPSQQQPQQHHSDETQHHATHRPDQLEQAMQRQREEHAANQAHDAAMDDVAHSHQMSSHAFAEVSLAPLPAADLTVVQSGMPSLLSARCGRSLLYAFLLALALANLVVALPQPEPLPCRMLSNYALGVGIVLALTVPFLHFCVRTGREVLMPAFVPYVVLVMLVCATFVSCTAIAWLAHDTCPDDRAMRQTVLADVMLVLGTALALAFYALLRWRFPLLVFSRVSQQLAKSGALALVSAALVCDIANLVAHAPEGRMNYHWGLGPRPQACQIECPIPSSFNPDSTRRPLQCFNAEALAVDAAFCAGVEKPDATVDSDLALAPCPLPLCACTPQQSFPCDVNATAHHYAVQYDAIDDPETSPLGKWCIDPRSRSSFGYGGDWNEVQPPRYAGPGRGGGGRRPIPGMPTAVADMWWGGGGNNLLQHTFQMRLGCRSLAANETSPSEWVPINLCAPWGGPMYIDYTLESAQRVRSPEALPSLPAPFTSPYMPVQFSLPESPCPQGCAALWGSAVAFTAVFGCMSLALAVSVLCNCCRRDFEACWGECCGGRQQRAADAVELQGASSASSAAAAEAAAVSINPDDLSVLPSVPAASSSPHLREPAPDASMRSLCLLLCRVLGVIATQGFSAVAPWWRHALLFAGVLLLLALSGVACWSMLWLVNANCRDFILSSVMNACVTSVLTIAALVLIVRNKQRVFDRTVNPFESVGLLQREEEDSERSLSRQAEEDDQHESSLAASNRA